MNTVSVDTQADLDPKTVKNIKKFCTRVLEKLGTDNWEISLLFCGKKYMRDLNRTYRGIDASTDVLSFPQEKGFDGHPVYYAGDIVISLDDCREQAEQNNVPVEKELKQLVVHGLLHLHGLDHQSDKEEQKMLAKQDALLTQFEEVRIF